MSLNRPCSLLAGNLPSPKRATSVNRSTLGSWICSLKSSQRKNISYSHIRVETRTNPQRLMDANLKLRYFSKFLRSQYRWNSQFRGRKNIFDSFGTIRRDECFHTANEHLCLQKQTLKACKKSWNDSNKPEMKEHLLNGVFNLQRFSLLNPGAKEKGKRPVSIPGISKLKRFLCSFKDCKGGKKKVTLSIRSKRINLSSNGQKEYSTGNVKRENFLASQRLDTFKNPQSVSGVSELQTQQGMKSMTSGKQQYSWTMLLPRPLYQCKVRHRVKALPRKKNKYFFQNNVVRVVKRVPAANGSPPEIKARHAEAVMRLVNTNKRMEKRLRSSEQKKKIVSVGPIYSKRKVSVKYLPGQNVEKKTIKSSTPRCTPSYIARISSPRKQLKPAPDRPDTPVRGNIVEVVYPYNWQRKPMKKSIRKSISSKSKGKNETSIEEKSHLPSPHLSAILQLQKKALPQNPSISNTKHAIEMKTSVRQANTLDYNVETINTVRDLPDELNKKVEDEVSDSLRQRLLLQKRIREKTESLALFLDEKSVNRNKPPSSLIQAGVIPTKKYLIPPPDRPDIKLVRTHLKANELDSCREGSDISPTLSRSQKRSDVKPLPPPQDRSDIKQMVPQPFTTSQLGSIPTVMAQSQDQPDMNPILPLSQGRSDIKPTLPPPPSVRPSIKQAMPPNLERPVIRPTVLPPSQESHQTSLSQTNRPDIKQTVMSPLSNRSGEVPSPPPQANVQPVRVLVPPPDRPDLVPNASKINGMRKDESYTMPNAQVNEIEKKKAAETSQLFRVSEQENAGLTKGLAKTTMNQKFDHSQVQFSSGIAKSESTKTFDTIKSGTVSPGCADNVGMRAPETSSVAATNSPKLANNQHLKIDTCHKVKPLTDSLSDQFDGKKVNLCKREFSCARTLPRLEQFKKSVSALRNDDLCALRVKPANSYYPKIKMKRTINQFVNALPNLLSQPADSVRPLIARDVTEKPLSSLSRNGLKEKIQYKNQDGYFDLKLRRFSLDKNSFRSTETSEKLAEKCKRPLMLANDFTRPPPAGQKLTMQPLPLANKEKVESIKIKMINSYGRDTTLMPLPNRPDQILDGRSLKKNPDRPDMFITKVQLSKVLKPQPNRPETPEPYLIKLEPPPNRPDEVKKKINAILNFPLNKKTEERMSTFMKNKLRRWVPIMPQRYIKEKSDMLVKSSSHKNIDSAFDNFPSPMLYSKNRSTPLVLVQTGSVASSRNNSPPSPFLWHKKEDKAASRHILINTNLSHDHDSGMISTPQLSTSRKICGFIGPSPSLRLSDGKKPPDCGSVETRTFTHNSKKKAVRPGTIRCSQAKLSQVPHSASLPKFASATESRVSLLKPLERAFPSKSHDVLVLPPEFSSDNVISNTVQRTLETKHKNSIHSQGEKSNNGLEIQNSSVVEASRLPHEKKILGTASTQSASENPPKESVFPAVLSLRAHLFNSSFQKPNKLRKKNHPIKKLQRKMQPVKKISCSESQKSDSGFLSTQLPQSTTTCPASNKSTPAYPQDESIYVAKSVPLSKSNEMTKSPKCSSNPPQSCHKKLNSLSSSLVNGESNKFSISVPGHLVEANIPTAETSPLSTNKKESQKKEESVLSEQSSTQTGTLPKNYNITSTEDVVICQFQKPPALTKKVGVTQSDSPSTQYHPTNELQSMAPLPQSSSATSSKPEALPITLSCIPLREKNLDSCPLVYPIRPSLTSQAMNLNRPSCPTSSQSSSELPKTLSPKTSSVTCCPHQIKNNPASKVRGGQSDKMCSLGSPVDETSNTNPSAKSQSSPKEDHVPLKYPFISEGTPHPPCKFSVQEQSLSSSLGSKKDLAQSSESQVTSQTSILTPPAPKTTQRSCSPILQDSLSQISLSNETSHPPCLARPSSPLPSSLPASTSSFCPILFPQPSSTLSSPSVSRVPKAVDSPPPLKCTVTSTKLGTDSCPPPNKNLSVPAHRASTTCCVIPEKKSCQQKTSRVQSSARSISIPPVDCKINSKNKTVSPLPREPLPPPCPSMYTKPRPLPCPPLFKNSNSQYSTPFPQKPPSIPPKSQSTPFSVQLTEQCKNVCPLSPPVNPPSLSTPVCPPGISPSISRALSHLPLNQLSSPTQPHVPSTSSRLNSKRSLKGQSSKPEKPKVPSEICRRKSTVRHSNPVALSAPLPNSTEKMTSSITPRPKGSVKYHFNDPNPPEFLINNFSEVQEATPAKSAMINKFTSIIYGIVPRPVFSSLKNSNSNKLHRAPTTSEENDKSDTVGVPISSKHSPLVDECPIVNSTCDPDSTVKSSSQICSSKDKIPKKQINTSQSKNSVTSKTTGNSCHTPLKEFPNSDICLAFNHSENLWRNKLSPRAESSFPMKTGFEIKEDKRKLFVAKVDTPYEETWFTKQQVQSSKRAPTLKQKPPKKISLYGRPTVNLIQKVKLDGKSKLQSLFRSAELKSLDRQPKEKSQQKSHPPQSFSEKLSDQLGN